MPCVIGASGRDRHPDTSRTNDGGNGEQFTIRHDGKRSRRRSSSTRLSGRGLD